MSILPFSGKTNLVFEGGGVKGLAYIGAIKALDEAGVLNNITAVAGTSAGAITACLLSLRYSPDELKKIVFDMPLAKFEDGRKWGPIINDILDVQAVRKRYGINPGDFFLNYLEQLIGDPRHGFEKGGRATFHDFQSHHCRDLRVYACNLNMRTIVEFSVEKTPTVAVADAVRASMSIPLFFQAFQFPDGGQSGHYFVDGGTVFNYPIGVFDKGPGGAAATLGFRLENKHAVPTDHGPDGPKELKAYVESLFNLLLAAQTIDYQEDVENERRSIAIDDFGISATDFGLSKEMMQKLYDSGYGAVKSHEVVQVSFSEREEKKHA